MIVKIFSCLDIDPITQNYYLSYEKLNNCYDCKFSPKGIKVDKKIKFEF